jgi:hypothetical protein
MQPVPSARFLPRIRSTRRVRPGLSFRLWFSAPLACLLAAVSWLPAQNAMPSEYQVKAVYLYNFGRFVEWPAQVMTGRDSFAICVLGQDPFGPTLDATLVGETIAGRVVTAKRIASPQESDDCRILFLSSAEANSLKKIIEAMRKHAVLTVSDMPQFVSRGGMIQFVLEDKRVRFEVNLTAAQEAGLTLSSELLKVATTVRRSSPSGD